MATNWNLRADCYDQLQWNRNKLFRKWLLNFINPSPSDKILDIGCGTGELWKNCEFKSNVVGIDNSKSMINSSKKVINCYRKEAFNFDEIKVRFNKIIMCMVLHHIKDELSLIKKIYNYLNTDNVFILCEGICPDEKIIDWYTQLMLIKEPHRNIYTAEKLINLTSDFNVTHEIYDMKQVSLNNWIKNSDLDEDSKRKIIDIHYNSSENIKTLYNMKVVENDIYMDWKFMALRCIK